VKGKITNFKAEKGFGFILGEDNKKYFFHISNVSNPMDIEENYSVDFKVKEAKKGLNAR
jgi:CspA family cold shock protein